MSTTALISKEYPVTYIRTQDGPTTYIENRNSMTRISEKLPFRVRFLNTKIGGYSPSNPAPIGIAVIGVNNYIF